MEYTHVVTSGKLMLMQGCTSLAEAEALAAEWEARAPVGRNDLSSPATVYTWPEWLEIAEANEADPFEGLHQ